MGLSVRKIQSNLQGLVSVLKYKYFFFIVLFESHLCYDVILNFTWSDYIEFNMRSNLTNKDMWRDGY